MTLGWQGVMQTTGGKECWECDKLYVVEIVLRLGRIGGRCASPIRDDQRPDALQKYARRCLLPKLHGANGNAAARRCNLQEGGSGGWGVIDIFQ
jgi:hypothetical protein